MQISLLIQTRLLFQWRKCYYDLWTRILGRSSLKRPRWIYFSQICSFSLLKMLTDGLEWCGLLVDYCDVFISCLDSHSDGTHSLQRIHWWASDGLLYSFKSDEETNSSWTPLGWVNVEVRWTIALKIKVPERDFHSDAIEELFRFPKEPFSNHNQFFLSMKNILTI